MAACGSGGGGGGVFYSAVFKVNFGRLAQRGRAGLRVGTSSAG